MSQFLYSDDDADAKAIVIPWFSLKTAKLKMRKCISLFHALFSTLSDTKSVNCALSIICKCIHLEQPKISMHCKEITLYNRIQTFNDLEKEAF